MLSSVLGTSSNGFRPRTLNYPQETVTIWKVKLSRIRRKKCWNDNMRFATLVLHFLKRVGLCKGMIVSGFEFQVTDCFYKPSTLRLWTYSGFDGDQHQSTFLLTYHHLLPSLSNSHFCSVFPHFPRWTINGMRNERIETIIETLDSC